jgi:hypothetical protein
MHELDPSNDHPTRAEIFRAARMCAPCMDRLGVLTYQASPMNESLRARWCDSVLMNHLMPAVSAAHLATGNFGFRELLEVDARLDSGLAGPMAASSRAAGRIVAMDFRPPTAERALKRYCEAVESRNSSGHIATVLSARAAVFHIPPRMALAALVFLEMRAAPVASFWNCVEACMQQLPPDARLLRAA